MTANFEFLCWPSLYRLDSRPDVRAFQALAIALTKALSDFSSFRHRKSDAGSYVDAPRIDGIRAMRKHLTQIYKLNDPGALPYAVRMYLANYLYILCLY